MIEGAEADFSSIMDRRLFTYAHPMSVACARVPACDEQVQTRRVSHSGLTPYLPPQKGENR
jgi:hypothetical protein